MGDDVDMVHLVTLRFIDGFHMLHHPRLGKAEVVLAGATHNDVVEDADADVL